MTINIIEHNHIRMFIDIFKRLPSYSKIRSPSSQALHKITKYSGSLKIRTRMCKGFWWKSGFFGKVLFGKNAKVRIFWTSPVLRKDKSPDFLEKCHFPKTQNYEFCTKTLDKLIWNPFFKGSDLKKMEKTKVKNVETWKKQHKMIDKMNFEKKIHVGRVICPDF